jgi:hypothetical protein
VSYSKTIVCLANSRKMSGRCVAGKEIDAKRHLGPWIRPISDRETQEVSEEERWFENGKDPKLLDIIRIEMLEPRPHAHQSENHLIDSRYYWVREGKLDWGDIQSAIDRVDTLWTNGYHSYNGENDRIPEDRVAALGGSLLLVKPENLVITVGVEGGGAFRSKRKVRARFALGRAKYVIAITDPVVERLYHGKEDGEYPVRDALLCISIGEPFQGFCYKLIAAVLTPEALD